MAREITANTPVVEIYLLAPSNRVLSKAEAGYELTELRNALRPLVRKLTDLEVDFDWRIDEEAKCGFCGYRWTEKSTTYNGGCCDADEAHNPASAMSTGTAKTPQAVEGQSPASAAPKEDAQ
jgi:hypothetical protein